MRSFLISTVALFSSLCPSAYAAPGDPSATVPTSSTAVPAATAVAHINGTMHHVVVGEKLAVVSMPASTTSGSPGQPTASTKPGPNQQMKYIADGPTDDTYSIDFKGSDWKGSSYCSKHYKSFWYTNWDTDHTKRGASCDAVAYNSVAKYAQEGYTKVFDGEVFWGPEKDGTNVCYWHYECPGWNECWKSGGTDCGTTPSITFKNIQNM